MARRLLRRPLAISPDGRYIVGWGYNAATGRDEAFLLDTGCTAHAGMWTATAAWMTPTCSPCCSRSVATGQHLGTRRRQLRRHCRRRGLAAGAVQLREWVLALTPSLSPTLWERGVEYVGARHAVPLHIRARGEVRANLYTPTKSSCLRYRSRWSWGRVRQIRNCLRRMFRNRRLTRFQLAMSPLRRVRVSRMSYTPT
jgi:hypothetical protein